MNNPILEMRDVSKSFFGCVLSTLPSMGENGAGKSTLMKILSGAYSPAPGADEIVGFCFCPISLKKSAVAAQRYQ